MLNDCWIEYGMLGFFYGFYSMFLILVFYVYILSWIF